MFLSSSLPPIVTLNQYAPQNNQPAVLVEGARHGHFAANARWLRRWRYTERRFRHVSARARALQPAIPAMALSSCVPASCLLAQARPARALSTPAPDILLPGRKQRQQAAHDDFRHHFHL